MKSGPPELALKALAVVEGLSQGPAAVQRQLVKAGTIELLVHVSNTKAASETRRASLAGLVQLVSSGSVEIQSRVFKAGAATLTEALTGE